MHPISISDWKHTKDRNLADPAFYIPGKIDLLLGADIFDQIVLETKVREIDSAFLRETVFGWIVSGCINSPNPNLGIKTFHAVLDTCDLRRFWELEVVPMAQPLTSEELECEEHFVKTTQRGPDGRFVVKLPFKRSLTKLGDSFPKL